MLTKAEAIRLHRILWNWIAQTSIKEQRCIEKEEAFIHFGWPNHILNCCWCCEYTEGCIDCYTCPVVWENDYDTFCTDNQSEYHRWFIAVMRKDYIKAAKYAYMIAELPERK